MTRRFVTTLGAVLAAVSLLAGSADAANQCKSTCKTVKKDAFAAAQTAFKECKTGCGSLSGSEKKACVKTCKDTRKAARSEASSAFKAAMPACKADKNATACGGSGTTTTTLAACTGTPGQPSALSYVVPLLDENDPATRSDLDNGYSGDSHNFTVTQASTLNFCLSGCDTTSNPVCQAAGATGPGTSNGETFGAPLPLLANNVPVCVVNRFKDPQITGTYNLQTGEMQAQVNLLADTYVLTDTTLKNVCPRCSGDGTLGSTGKCVGGQTPGKSCTVNGLAKVSGSLNGEDYQLSSDCLPEQIKFGATLVVELPLTSGTSSKSGSKPCPGQTNEDSCGGGTCSFDCSGTNPTKGGINQLCCSNNQTKPCFPTATDSGSLIERTGIPAPVSPAWPDPTYPKTASGAKAAAVFCEAKTGSSQVDILTGLPGPAAIILPGNVTVSLGQ